MDAPSILGLIGTLLDLIRAAPQLGRLIRARKSFGVSVDTSGTSCVVSLGWTVYGVVTNQPFVTLASGVMASFFFIITVVALRLGRSVSEFRIAPLWLIILLAAGLSFGTNGLGAVLSVSVLASNIPQIRVAYNEKNLSTLSLETWLLSLTGGVVWGFYGILGIDFSIIASAFFQVTTSIMIIIL
ncbi:MAG: hypothetical protein KA473_12535, partial [Anaerolineales bacterium]|nr:hypothetical protein [Anaerolineales bacterium]MBP6210255.1 hypothetical protein [Anaerolineales bacterium]